MATFDDFLVLDIRAGTIREACVFPEARKPAYKLHIDFGPDIGVRRSSAQITANYSVDELPGLQVLGVVNLPPRQVGPFVSEVLVLGVPDAEGGIVLARPCSAVLDGAKLA